MTRERAIEVLKAWDLNWSDSFTANEFEQAFAMAISALSDKRGDWINETPHADGCPIYTCSECGRSNLWESPFCPSCGADMREPKGEKGTE